MKYQVEAEYLDKDSLVYDGDLFVREHRVVMTVPNEWWSQFDCARCGRSSDVVVLSEEGTWTEQSFHYCPVCGAAIEWRRPATMPKPLEKRGKR